jgi:hypothetical protein
MSLSRLKSLTVSAAFVAMLPLLGLVEIELRNRRLQGLDPFPVEAYRLPPKRVLRAMSFGYNEVMADLLWIRTITYFTDHLSTDRDLRYLGLHLNNILSLDEYFKPVYRYGAAMFMSQGTAQTNEQVFFAINLSKRAHRLFPDDWRFPLYTGSYYLNELRTKDPEQRARWRREGADWIYRASLIGAHISWLPSLAAKVYTEQGERDLAILLLQELYMTVQDEDTKAQIAEKLKDMQMKQLVLKLQQTFARFEKAHGSSSIRFISKDLFMLVSTPPPEPFSLEELVDRR